MSYCTRKERKGRLWNILTCCFLPSSSTCYLVSLFQWSCFVLLLLEKSGKRESRGCLCFVCLFLFVCCVSEGEARECHCWVQFPLQLHLIHFACNLPATCLPLFVLGSSLVLFSDSFCWKPVHHGVYAQLTVRLLFVVAPPTAVL